MKGLYQTLVKRELWEHRSLWLAPTLAAALILLVALFGLMAAPQDVQFRVPMGNRFGEGDLRGSGVMFASVIGLTSQLYLIAGLVVTIYLLDCLYSERKDRSILFWKSLPVSDFQTVITKFAVGMLTPPVLAFVLGIVVYPIIHAVSTVAVPEFMASAGGWSMSEWLRAEGRVLSCMLVTTLWFAPLGAWYLLASVLSSRSPYFLAGLPVVVLGICEGILLHTNHVWRLVGRRITPIFDPLAGLQRPSLWIGLAVAAGMLYIVIRLRRYRDDT